MHGLFLKDEFCTEDIYKYIYMRPSENIFLGISDFEYETRKELFQKLFPNTIVCCLKNNADYVNAIKEYALVEVALSKAFKNSDSLIEELMKTKVNVSFIDQNLETFHLHTNRFLFKPRKSVKELLDEKGFVRVIETNSGLSSMLLQQLTEVDSTGKEIKFDAFWMSSLCDSLQRGKPDHEITDLFDRLISFTWTKEISNLPVIFDLDSGGTKEHFLDSLISLYNRGVSAVVIEDKIGEKINSLAENCTQQRLDSAENFADKIKCGRKMIKDDSFMVIARIESLIMGYGIDEAIKRAKQYLQANADAILIHYNKSNYMVLRDFCKAYNQLPNRKPLVVVPTRYPFVTDEELKSWGINMVIYANHVTRSIIPAICKTGSAILKNGRALEACTNCISVEETLNLVGNDFDEL